MGTRWRLLRGKVQTVWRDGLSRQKESGRVPESKGHPTFIPAVTTCAVGHCVFCKTSRPLVVDWPFSFLYCTGCCNLRKCGFCAHLEMQCYLLIDWPLARYSTRVAYCSCSDDRLPQGLRIAAVLIIASLKGCVLQLF